MGRKVDLFGLFVYSFINKRKQYDMRASLVASRGRTSFHFPQQQQQRVGRGIAPTSVDHHGRTANPAIPR
jgi:hypothetical protein